MRNRLFVCFLLAVSVAISAQNPDALKIYQEGRDLEDKGDMISAEAKYRESVAICLQEISVTPRNIESYVVIGWCYIRLKEYELAREYSTKALEISRNPRIIDTLGEALYYLGKPQEALNYFEEYIAAIPKDDRASSVYFFMGECFIALGQYNRADIALSTAVYLTANMPWWWYRLGYAREMAKEYPQAVVAYGNALKLNPNLVEAQNAKLRTEKKLP